MVYGALAGECGVCGEMTSVQTNAQCLRCGKSFHLALRQDVPTKECGQVWISEESQALEFACNVCLGVAAPREEKGEKQSAGGRYARRAGLRAADLVRERRDRRRR